MAKNASSKIIKRGNCYICVEALYHLLGGKMSEWASYSLKYEDDTHWFLKNKKTGCILDPTVSQFKTPPDYSNGRGRGFLMKEPSKRARKRWYGND